MLKVRSITVTDIRHFKGKYNIFVLHWNVSKPSP